MATRRTPYVYGSAAPNIEVMPRREDDYERRRQTRPVSRPRPKRKAKIDKVAVLLTALTYNKATKQLGMVAASENQMDTYESRKSTQVRTHGDIPAE